jgi:hypothetical protein
LEIKGADPAEFPAHKVDVVNAIVHDTDKQQDWDAFNFDQDMRKFS